MQRKYAKQPITYGEQYRRLRNQVTNKLNAARRTYYQNKSREYSGNAKKTWQLINEVLNRKKKSKISNKFIVNDEETTDPEVIASKFNYYFVNIGKQLSEAARNEHLVFREYLQEQQRELFEVTPITTNELTKVI